MERYTDSDGEIHWLRWTDTLTQMDRYTDSDGQIHW